jgi:alkaline phosphatase
MKAFENVVKISLLAVCVTILTASNLWGFKFEDRFFQSLHSRGIKNVIVMIPDGCDETIQTVARWYKGKDLQIDKMQNASVKVHMANSVIPGSAAAATSFATGQKTTVRFLGVGPRRGDLLSIYDPEDMAPEYAPVASILEAAKLKGMSTGIAATSRVTHATPAAFACHIEDRGWDNDIMEHMVYNNIDVVFGGGARHLIPKDEKYTTTFGATWKGKRTDGENLMDVLLKRGYRFVDNRDDMLQLNAGKVWGLFDDSHMQPDMDRKHFAVHEPSLAEMVQKAIDLLSNNPNGFLLMVEASQVDWAGHNNDPIYMVTDFIAFDNAVKVACDFAEKDGRTLVLAYPDHNTGGMKIGHYETAMHYTATTVEDLVEPLKGMTITSGGLVKIMSDKPDDAELIAKVKEYWGLDINQDDVDEIRALEPSVGLNYAIARVLSKNYTVFGWTTHGHNGETVPLWVCGVDAPVGTIDNTDLALIAADALGVNLDYVTSHLYVDINTVTDDWEIDLELVEECNEDKSDCSSPGEIFGNGVLFVNDAEFPISKNIMKYKGQTFKLPGLTVYASGDDYVDETVYISRKAVKLLQWFKQL